MLAKDEPVLLERLALFERAGAAVGVGAVGSGAIATASVRNSAYYGSAIISHSRRHLSASRICSLLARNLRPQVCVPSLTPPGADFGASSGFRTPAVRGNPLCATAQHWLLSLARPPSTDSLICSSVSITSDPSTIQSCSEGSISLKLAGIFYNESPKLLILFISAHDS